MSIISLNLYRYNRSDWFIDRLRWRQWINLLTIYSTWVYTDLIVRPRFRWFVMTEARQRCLRVKWADWRRNEVHIFHGWLYPACHYGGGDFSFNYSVIFNCSRFDSDEFIKRWLMYILKTYVGNNWFDSVEFSDRIESMRVLIKIFDIGHQYTDIFYLQKWAYVEKWR